MYKKYGIAFVGTGAVLVLLAVTLLFVNTWEEHRAGKEAELLLGVVYAAIEDETEAAGPSEIRTETNPEEAKDKNADDADDMTMVEETAVPKSPVQEITRYECIGYLTVPGMALELPVIAEWDYDRLETAPCRHFGSADTDDLVIAGHDYKAHFGSLPAIKIGDSVLFTDMNGDVNRYTVTEGPRIVSADAVDAVRYSGHDLVLYTCTTDGDERIAVFCDRTA